MEKRAKYAKIHPEMSNLDLTKILSKKYKELPDKKKVRCPSQRAGPRSDQARSGPAGVPETLTVLPIRSKSTSQSSSERRKSLRRTWPDSSESPPPSLSCRRLAASTANVS